MQTIIQVDRRGAKPAMFIEQGILNVRTPAVKHSGVRLSDQNCLRNNLNGPSSLPMASTIAVREFNHSNA